MTMQYTALLNNRIYKKIIGVGDELNGQISPTRRKSLSKYLKRLKHELIVYRQLRYNLSNQKIQDIEKLIENSKIKPSN